VAVLLYAQPTHAIGLNDVCDALRLRSDPLSALRGATPPNRNNLLHANKHRDASLAEKLFWSVLDHLKRRCFFAFPLFAPVNKRVFTDSLQQA
jgi:hypothetical protein